MIKEKAQLFIDSRLRRLSALIIVLFCVAGASLMLRAEWPIWEGGKVSSPVRIVYIKTAITYEPENRFKLNSIQLLDPYNVKSGTWRLRMYKDATSSTRYHVQYIGAGNQWENVARGDRKANLELDEYGIMIPGGDNWEGEIEPGNTVTFETVVDEREDMVKTPAIDQIIFSPEGKFKVHNIKIMEQHEMKEGSWMLKMNKDEPKYDVLYDGKKVKTGDRRAILELDEYGIMIPGGGNWEGEIKEGYTITFKTIVFKRNSINVYDLESAKDGKWEMRFSIKQGEGYDLYKLGKNGQWMPQGSGEENRRFYSNDRSIVLIPPIIGDNLPFEMFKSVFFDVTGAVQRKVNNQYNIGSILDIYGSACRIKEFHTGVDIIAQINATVGAMQEGMLLTTVGDYRPEEINILHGNEVYTYHHIKRSTAMMEPNRPMWIKENTKIGEIASGIEIPHLHYGVLEARFQITEACLKKLEELNAPKNIQDKLKKIQSEVWYDKTQFLEGVRSQFKKEDPVLKELAKYEDNILRFIPTESLRSVANPFRRDLDAIDPNPDKKVTGFGNIHLKRDDGQHYRITEKVLESIPVNDLNKIVPVITPLINRDFTNRTEFYEILKGELKKAALNDEFIDKYTAPILKESGYKLNGDCKRIGNHLYASGVLDIVAGGMDPLREERYHLSAVGGASYQVVQLPGNNKVAGRKLFDYWTFDGPLPENTMVGKFFSEMDPKTENSRIYYYILTNNTGSTGEPKDISDLGCWDTTKLPDGRYRIMVQFESGIVEGETSDWMTQDVIVDNKSPVVISSRVVTESNDKLSPVECCHIGKVVKFTIDWDQPMSKDILPVIEVQYKILTYIIDEQTLESLKNSDIIKPDVYSRIASLKDKKFEGQDAFNKALETTLGAQLTYPIKMVILKYVPGKDGWLILPAPENYNWSEAVKDMPNSRLELNIRMPSIPQRIFNPRFRISVARGLGSFMHGNLEHDEMEPYTTNTQSLFLLPCGQSYIITEKDRYRPGEAIDGRYNINTALIPGKFELQFFQGNNRLWLRKVDTCGWIGPNVDAKQPGNYTFKLVQIKEDKILELAATTFTVE